MTVDSYYRDSKFTNNHVHYCKLKRAVFTRVLNSHLDSFFEKDADATTNAMLPLAIYKVISIRIQACNNISVKIFYPCFSDYTEVKAFCDRIMQKWTGFVSNGSCVCLLDQICNVCQYHKWSLMVYTCILKYNVKATTCQISVKFQ